MICPTSNKSNPQSMGCFFFHYFPFEDTSPFLHKKAIPSEPLRPRWDYYFNRKYIPHNMQGSYLRVMGKMGLNDTMHPTWPDFGRICTPLRVILGNFAPHLLTRFAPLGLGIRKNVQLSDNRIIFFGDNFEIVFFVIWIRNHSSFAFYEINIYFRDIICCR